MKVKLNPMFEEVSGQLGDLVFRELRGETIASRKPSVSGEPTPVQLAHRERFKLAAAYGKSVMASAETRALYEEAAKSKNMPVFALTIADFFNTPTISSIDLSGYTGQLGNLIKISATDDFGVASVHVTISDAQGNAPIENGNALETAPGSGVWLYAVQTALNPLTTVNIQVVATDRPGGTAILSASKTL